MTDNLATNAALIAEERVAPPADRESGWLIERAGQWYAASPHTDWTIRQAVNNLHAENWTWDASAALRFARKVDAETLIRFVGWQNAVATEHVFIGASVSPPPVDGGRWADADLDTAAHAMANDLAGGDVGWALMPSEQRREYIYALKAALLSLAASPQPVGGGWRPIESAPRESAILVTWEPPRHGVVKECPCIAVQQRYTPLPGMEVRRRWMNPHGDKLLPVPTHWQPLPSPPLAEPTPEGGSI
jgi:hypothetical protein